MTCPQCLGIEEVFSQPYVSKELSNYRRKGPAKTTRMLIEAIKEMDVDGMTLLDIGGGVGAIQHELLDAGAKEAIDVDASTTYINAAKSEAVRRGLDEHVRYYLGDFVDLAADITSADIVTLDRVICCYDDMEKLVSLSAERAHKLYGLVYPRDTWWVKFGLAVGNFFSRIMRSPYRAFAHPTQAVEALVRRVGLKQTSYHQTFVWQVVVYTR